ncbi:hypothetical protein [Parasitella parasitica]|uniref:Uncharacterized protein n=1 Tax=Parasitella parasitica TaxID=35722 RepID=A0A0B7MM13_9FUNG|nr:hypothetical protein [Parasitella parasitica]
MAAIPTYQHALSTTDYVSAVVSLRHLVKDAAVGFISPTWSDHAILEVNFQLGKSKLGPGLWRATTKKVIKRFGVKHVHWRRLSIRHLERKRNRLLSSKPPRATLRILLPQIDSMLQILQQVLVNISALKAGDNWREKGERFAGYLKRLHQTRTSQQYMANLQTSSSTAKTHDSDTGTPEDFGAHGTSGTSGGVGLKNPEISDDAVDPIVNDERPLISDRIDDMKEFAWQFYANLYKADLVSPSANEEYLDTIKFEWVLTTEEQDSLLAPITLKDLIEHSNQSVKATAPGSDGLSYPLLSLLFEMPKLQALL